MSRICQSELFLSQMLARVAYEKLVNTVIRNIIAMKFYFAI